MQNVIDEFKTGKYKALVVATNSSGDLGADAQELIKAFPMVKFAHLNFKKAMADLGGEASEVNMLGNLVIEKNQYGDIVLAYIKLKAESPTENHMGLLMSSKKIGLIYRNESVLISKDEYGSFQSYVKDFASSASLTFL